jgi:hypothetical protein
MSWSVVFMVMVLALAAAGILVIGYVVLEASRAAKHKRDVEWLEAQARTGLTVRKDP